MIRVTVARSRLYKDVASQRRMTAILPSLIAGALFFSGSEKISADDVEITHATNGVLDKHREFDIGLLIDAPEDPALVEALSEIPNRILEALKEHYKGPHQVSIEVRLFKGARLLAEKL